MNRAGGAPDFAEVIDLDRRTESVFRANRHQTNHIGGAFGGSLLAQAVRAAELHSPDRMPHSMHAHFLSGAAGAEPIDYEVSVVRDGRAFSSRRVVAVQRGRTVLDAAVSLQAPEEGFTHQLAWTPPPPPEAAVSVPEFLRRHRQDLPGTEIEIIEQFEAAMETRFVAPEDLTLRPSEPKVQIWVRPRTRDRELPATSAALALVSDYLMPAACNRPHARSTFDPGLMALSLDHVIWFHARPRTGEWMFYDAVSPWAGHGRGLNFGQLYDTTGVLLASCAQEQMIRSRKSSAK